MYVHESLQCYTDAITYKSSAFSPQIRKQACFDTSKASSLIYFSESKIIRKKISLTDIRIAISVKLTTTSFV